MKKIFLKVSPLITAILLLTMLTVPVLAAGGAHLHFFSVDPTTIDPPDPMPNGDLDPNYMGVDADPWLTESVVVASGDWSTPFSLWIGNQDKDDTSYDTTLVVSVNDVAAAAIVDIEVGGTSILPWNTDKNDFPLPPHGISNSAEYYGFASTVVGDIAPETALEINIEITLASDLTDAKIHFDAYGWTNEGHETDDPKTANMTNPFSHDYTFVVPEPATIIAAASSLGALGVYAYKRKKR